MTIPGACSDVPGHRKIHMHRIASFGGSSSVTTSSPSNTEAQVVCATAGTDQQHETPFVNEISNENDHDNEPHLTSAELAVEVEPTQPTPLEALPVTCEQILCKFLQSHKGSFLLFGLGLVAIGLVIAFLIALVWKQPSFAFAMALGIVLILAMAVQVTFKMGHRLQQRISVLVMLIMVSLVVVSVFKSTQHWEELHLQIHFDALGQQLINGFHDHGVRQLQTMDMLSVGITLATHQSFPFVTIPDFAARATAAMALLGSKHVLLYPYVTQETRSEWEEYSMNHMEWINASRAFQQEFRTSHNHDESRSNSGSVSPSDSQPEGGEGRRRRQLQAKEIPESDYLYRPAAAPPVNRTAGTDGAPP